MIRFLREARAVREELLEHPHLTVSNSRIKSEGRLLRRAAPELYSRLRCRVDGLLHDAKRRRYTSDFLARKKPPLFTNIQLETVNRCNGGCSFCPVNRHDDPRRATRMPEGLFQSFVRQLSALDYDKIFGFFSNNEPLLDKRLPAFAEEARKRLPKATISTVTNGTLLTVDLFRRLMPSLNTVIVNDYNSAPGLNPNIKEVRDYCLTPEGQKLIAGKQVLIEMRNPSRVLGSRGGDAPNRNAVTRPIKALCLCFFRQFIVRPDGGISQCCNDALGQVTMGDLNDATAEEIWRDAPFVAARRTMVDEGRAAIPLCAKCDFAGWTPD